MYGNFSWIFLTFVGISLARIQIHIVCLDLEDNSDRFHRSQIRAFCQWEPEGPVPAPFFLSVLIPCLKNIFCWVSRTQITYCVKFTFMKFSKFFTSYVQQTWRALRNCRRMHGLKKTSDLSKRLNSYIISNLDSLSTLSLTSIQPAKFIRLREYLEWNLRCTYTKTYGF